MTEEKFIEILEDDINTKYNSNIYGVFEGLKIMSKYTAHLIDVADNDIIYGSDIDKLIDNGITEEECIKLNKFGWYIIDDEYLGHFV